MARERVGRNGGPGPAASRSVTDPRPALRIFAPLIFAALLSPLACSGARQDEAPADRHDDGEEIVGHASSPLAATASVATAASESCTTSAVKGLATQLVEEIECLKPGTFARIDKTPGLTLGAAVFPFLQASAAKNLVLAQKARGTVMTINSALRTLPQQYLLYHWYRTGRCNIGLAASPGTSNHEGAIAVDVEDNAGWRAAMVGSGFRWLGAGDPVHYDFTAGGTVDLHGISVEAFQRLWNRNNPTDKILENGTYALETAARLERSPSGGFAKGADCSKAAPGNGPAAGNAGTPPPPADEPVIPDATEPGTPGSGGSGTRSTGPDAAGCTTSPRGQCATPGTALALSAALALMVAVTRRRRARDDGRETTSERP